MNKENRNNWDIIVIGGGAAGLMAAGQAAELGARVLLLEKTDGCGKKILVSGKTRCNLTNSANLNHFIAMYGDNGRFLFNAFHHFFRPELLDFVNSQGLETKVERGGRIFPVSDDAHDVLRVFKKYLDANNVRIQLNTKATDIIVKENAVCGVKAHDTIFNCKAVILATGGATWPSTGSAGDGYTMSAALGHTVVKLRPSLVPLIVKEQKLAQAMQGVSLRNVRATAFQGEAASIDSTLTPDCVYGRGEKKRPKYPVIESRFGEMLFTHFGLGGPIILLMSLSVVEALEKGPVSVLIDLKTALTREQLHKRLQTDLDKFSKRKITGIIKDYLPAKMIEPFIALTGIEEDKQAHQINAEERGKIVELLKALRFNIKSALPLEKAIVTAGGISLKEIDPRTMASRLIHGLYFCGEVMDIDADTGGYNLQAAFSTGYLAGQKAAGYAKISGEQTK
ncbi:MAG TPA: NAD(P)/FAD-dependent oxidoreductase [Smithella sp.]|nr:NAD(P)/FAD-dependent oxidoreductase [Smithella sp.]HNY50894.1 NAD(P)/FAD-dependent oxidoreductase [Smithella sp.]HOG90876.1 NAD(P)/FAD-dependent oxidoreductase [Smithella sp.]